MKLVKVTDHRSYKLHFDCWHGGQWHEMYIGNITPDEKTQPFTFEELRASLVNQFMPKIIETGKFMYDNTVVDVSAFAAYRIRVTEENKKEEE